MAVYNLGMGAKLYYGPKDGTGTPTNELSNVKDVTLNMTTATADVTTRANDGWRATASTLKECTADFTMQWDETDEGFSDIFQAFLSNEPLRLAILTEANGSGPVGQFTVTSCTRNEPLDDVITADITVSVSKFEEWKDTSTDTEPDTEIDP